MIEADRSMAAICVTNVYELACHIMSTRGDIVRAAIFNNAALRARRILSGDDSKRMTVLKSNLRRLDAALCQENGVPEGMNVKQFIDWLRMRDNQPWSYKTWMN